MQQICGNLSRLLPFALVLMVGVGLSFAAAAYTDQQAESRASALFERDASSATAEIEREIERHVGVVEETAAFAEATWPGSVNEWREFTDGRVTGGTALAFTSTAGVIERVPADQIAAFEAREAASSGEPFTLLELAPLAPDADRIVLTRTGDDTAGGIQIRGLEVSSVSTLLGVELPSPGDGIAVDSIEEAPESVLDLLSIEASDFGDNDVLNSNVMLSHAIGAEGQAPLGWVIVPAELGNLLIRAIENLDRTQLNIAIAIPETELKGDLGRYEGDPGLPFGNASLASETVVDFGGWEWRVRVWADEPFGMNPNRIRGEHVLVAGIGITLVFALILHAQRLYLRRLRAAELEANLNRTLAETDPLTGLANRQGLQTFVKSDAVSAGIERLGCAILFLDLDRFKEINDGLGHAAGDALLTAVGRATLSVARDEDVVGRMGGDEFVVICPGLCDEQSTDALVSRLTEAISSIQEPASVNASIGVSVVNPGRTFDLDAALSAADAAMYTAKKQRKSGGRRSAVNAMIQRS